MNMILSLVLISIFLVNIFFGYWRSNTKRFSIQWVLAIHIPVPLAIGLRLSLLGWSWAMLPAFVAAFAAGQYTGDRVRHRIEKSQWIQPSSCLVMDLARILPSAY